MSSQVKNSSVILMPLGYRNFTVRYGNRQGKCIRRFTGVKEPVFHSFCLFSYLGMGPLSEERPKKKFFFFTKVGKN